MSFVECCEIHIRIGVWDRERERERERKKGRYDMRGRDGIAVLSCRAIHIFFFFLPPSTYSISSPQTFLQKHTHTHTHTRERESTQSLTLSF